MTSRKKSTDVTQTQSNYPSDEKPPDTSHRHFYHRRSHQSHSGGSEDTTPLASSLASMSGDYAGHPVPASRRVSRNTLISARDHDKIKSTRTTTTHATARRDTHASDVSYTNSSDDHVMDLDTQHQYASPNAKSSRPPRTRYPSTHSHASTTSRHSTTSHHTTNTIPRRTSRPKQGDQTRHGRSTSTTPSDHHKRPQTAQEAIEMMLHAKLSVSQYRADETDTDTHGNAFGDGVSGTQTKGSYGDPTISSAPRNGMGSGGKYRVGSPRRDYTTQGSDVTTNGDKSIPIGISDSPLNAARRGQPARAKPPLPTHSSSVTAQQPMYTMPLKDTSQETMMSQFKAPSLWIRGKDGTIHTLGINGLVVAAAADASPPNTTSINDPTTPNQRQRRASRAKKPGSRSTSRRHDPNIQTTGTSTTGISDSHASLWSTKSIESEGTTRRRLLRRTLPRHVLPSDDKDLGGGWNNSTKVRRKQYQPVEVIAPLLRSPESPLQQAALVYQESLSGSGQFNRTSTGSKTGDRGQQSRGGARSVLQSRTGGIESFSNLEDTPPKTPGSAPTSLIDAALPEFSGIRITTGGGGPSTTIGSSFDSRARAAATSVGITPDDAASNTLGTDASNPIGDPAMLSVSSPLSPNSTGGIDSLSASAQGSISPGASINGIKSSTQTIGVASYLQRLRPNSTLLANPARRRTNIPNASGDNASIPGSVNSSAGIHRSSAMSSNPTILQQSTDKFVYQRGIYMGGAMKPHPGIYGPSYPTPSRNAVLFGPYHTHLVDYESKISSQSNACRLPMLFISPDRHGYPLRALDPGARVCLRYTNTTSPGTLPPVTHSHNLSSSSILLRSTSIRDVDTSVDQSTSSFVHMVRRDSLAAAKIASVIHSQL